MIHYFVSIDDMQGLEKALGMAKDKSKYVLRAAVNNAAKEAKKRMERGASKRYALNKGGVVAYRQINTLKKAAIGKPEAVIIARDGTMDLYEYKLNDRGYYPGSKGGPNQLKAKALKQSNLKPLALFPGARDAYKAFVVQFSSGHIAIAQRIPGSRMRKKNKEAIKALYAISKPKSEEVIWKKDVDDDISEILIKHVQEQLAHFLG